MGALAETGINKAEAEKEVGWNTFQAYPGATCETDFDCPKDKAPYCDNGKCYKHLQEKSVGFLNRNANPCDTKYRVYGRNVAKPCSYTPCCYYRPYPPHDCQTRA